MLPEVRVLIERAAARRFALDGLLDAIPGDYWARSAPGDAWPVRSHVEHLATIESLVTETVAAVIQGEREAWAGGAGSVDALTERRALLMAAVAGASQEELRASMVHSRAVLVASVETLEPIHLEAVVLVAGVVNSWGQPVLFSLREYLLAWPDHDTSHDAAIRRAMESPPDLSTAALVQRAQRRR